MKISRKVLNKIRFFLTGNGYDRASFLKKNKLLKEIGDNVFFQPRKLPDDPHLIKLHNNISIASGVIFINHDVTYKVFNYLEANSTNVHFGCIEIEDNVFIGANSVILPNVQIGANSIVGAGSIVTKDVPSGSVVAGVPAKVIGKFEDVFEKRKVEASLYKGKEKNIIFDKLWEEFYSCRK